MVVLDTDIMVDVLRRFPPALEWLGSLGEEEIVLPGYVVLELMDGQHDRESMNRLLRELEPYTVEWPSAQERERAVELFAHVSLSHGIGPLDILIAATTRGLGVPLHTFNVKHYEPIPGLETVQPYARTASAG